MARDDFKEKLFDFSNQLHLSLRELAKRGQADLEARAKRRLTVLRQMLCEAVQSGDEARVQELGLELEQARTLFAEFCLVEDRTEATPTLVGVD